MKFFVPAVCLILGFVICALAETGMESYGHPETQQDEVSYFFILLGQLFPHIIF